ncbi:hypothetical protein Ndes2526B_g00954 [Nannochloris sp. 'desiccata']
MHVILEAFFRVLGGFGLLFCLILVGYFLLWHTALKHLPPVQEALGLRKPLKPPLESKREEIEALKQQHARLRASFN